MPRHVCGSCSRGGSAVLLDLCLSCVHILRGRLIEDDMAASLHAHNMQHPMSALARCCI